jgi:hypothetical protein
MAFTVTLNHGRPYLLADLSGPAGRVDLCAAADFIGSACTLAQYRRALIDMQKTAPSLTFTDHLQIGGHIAQAFSGMDRVATVVKASDRVGTS